VRLPTQHSGGCAHRLEKNADCARAGAVGAHNTVVSVNIRLPRPRLGDGVRGPRPCLPDENSRAMPTGPSPIRWNAPDGDRS